MEQNVFLTKMIGIIVAVIVTAVVLIPICNSLTEGNGGSGGGEGDSSGDAILLNDVRALAEAQGYSDLPFGSFMLYTNTGSATPSHTITLDELREWKAYGDAHQFKWEIANGTYNGTSAFGNGYADFGIGWVAGSGSNPARLQIYMDDLAGDYFEYNTENVSEFAINILPSFEVEFVGKTLTNEDIYHKIPVDRVYYPIDDESGWAIYVHNGGDMPDFKATNGSMIDITMDADISNSTIYVDYILEFDEEAVEGDMLRFSIPVEVESSIVNVTGSIALASTGIEGEYSVGEITSDNEDWSMYVFATSTMNENPYGGEGDSSDSGSDLGTAGTIIGIIPIFVILSIIMYAVQYFRDPRKL